MGGSGGMFSRLVAPQAPAPAAPPPGASYQAPAVSRYAPQVQQGLPPSPLLQQIMAQNMQPMRGLGDLSIFGLGYTPRTMQSLPPMPRYVVPNYVPNRAPAPQSLNRVAISAAELQRRAAQAEAARMAASGGGGDDSGSYGGALQSYYDSSGGG